MHLFVGFRHAAERIFLDHRVHAGQRTEFHYVPRIFRCAGIPGPLIGFYPLDRKIHQPYVPSRVDELIEPLIVGRTQ